MRRSFLLISAILAACAPDVNDLENANAALSERAPAGLLNVMTSNATPEGNIILASDTVVVSVFDLSSTVEDMTLNNFQLRIPGQNRAVGSVAVQYEDENGDQQVAAGIKNAGMVTFTGLDVYVPMTGSSQLTVLATGASASSGARPGNSFSVDWTDNGVSAVGNDSGRGYGVQRTTDAASANGFTWHIAKPVLSPAPSQPSGDVDPSDINNLLEWNVATASNTGGLNASLWTFAVNSTDTGSSGWNTCGELSFSGSSGRNGNWRYFDSSGSTCVIGQPVMFASWRAQNAVAYDSDLDVSVAVNPVDASDGDTIQLILTRLDWTDAGIQADDMYVEQLPITGNTLTFMNTPALP